ncbi:nuclear transport factor 2 family protein [Wenzhouxiangella sp. XN201]|uniref:nuclear transport factor 2 family protein n=1 Tax=Wenzhouxiangella sp. XN201 TaxID=2710755 RepID=UPI0013CD79BF|nr:nuclear transport factor 2 family protein [Wenzhouxiangella sp. XN201]NEZ04583.1 nuclear transport factor 2 family protein [Wenzhouxiangella sp. XN201]
MLQINVLENIRIMQNKTWPLLFIVAALVISLLAGCQPAEEPQSVEERAQARWDLMVERDFESAWEYYSPGFRETGEQDDFAEDMQNRPVRWRDARVLVASCEEEDICIVEAEVTYQPVGGPSEVSGMKMTRILKERWIRLDGQWWYTTD